MIIHHRQCNKLEPTGQTSNVLHSVVHCTKHMAVNFVTNKSVYFNKFTHLINLFFRSFILNIRQNPSTKNEYLS